MSAADHMPTRRPRRLRVVGHIVWAAFTNLVVFAALMTFCCVPMMMFRGRGILTAREELEGTVLLPPVDPAPADLRVRVTRVLGRHSQVVAEMPLDGPLASDRVLRYGFRVDVQRWTQHSRGGWDMGGLGLAIRRVLRMSPAPDADTYQVDVVGAPGITGGPQVLRPNEPDRREVWRLAR
jgi:hypothetical protein